MILHIPHSSHKIPEEFRYQIILSDSDLAAEQLLMTDAFTDVLFSLPETSVVRFPISRLLLDPERFPNDAEEPMSQVGMGMIYTHTAYGKSLKRILQPDERRTLMSEYYEPHHRSSLQKFKMSLRNTGRH